MLRRVKAAARRVARPAAVAVRRGLVRLLRPMLLRVDAHLQWVFDRQQEDRARVAALERQLGALQRQVAALRTELRADPERARAA